MTSYIGGGSNDTYTLELGTGAHSITDSGGNDLLILKGTNTAGFGLYRDGADLKIRQTGTNDITTVKNFWSSASSSSAGTGYIETIDYRSIDTNSSLGVFKAALGKTGGLDSEWVIGTTGGDTLNGGAGNDRLSGDAGNDIINGGADNDVLLGGGGNDTMDGGNGGDRYVLNLGQGADVINDTGTSGTDVLHFVGTSTAGFGLYRDGADLKIRQTGTNDITTVKNFWSSASSSSAGTGYIETIDYRSIDTNSSLGVFKAALGKTGGLDSEWVIGTTGGDTLNGGAGNDRLSGDAGNDIINGGADNDVLLGGGGNDTMDGGNGGDRYVLNLGQGADVINDTGTSGTDVLHFVGTSTAGFGLYRDGADLKIRQTGTNDITTVKNFWSSASSSSAGTGYIETIDYRSIDTNSSLGVFKAALGKTGGLDSEWVIGTTGGDTLNGGAGNDRLSGDAGNDIINGGADNDVLLGGGGNDTMDGGNGGDRYVLNLGQGADVINDTGTSGTDVLHFVGTSTAGFGLYRDGADLKIRQTGTNDITTVKNFWSSASSSSAGTGYIETIDYRSIDTNSSLGVFKAALGKTGGLDSEWVIGTTGGDTLNGGAGNDRLSGDAGNDIINGGADNDVLLGGGGNDTMDGGNGGDRYVLNLGQGADVINDTGTSGTDVLHFVGTSTAGFGLYRDGADLKIRQTGTNDITTVKNFWSSASSSSAGTGYIETIDYRSIDTNSSLGVFKAALGKTGGLDSEWVIGTTGGDTLNGGAGNDRLSGDAGNDIINGGADNDVLLGGGGNDYFDFTSQINASPNIDIVIDFTPGSDKIRLENSVMTNLQGTAGTLTLASYWEGAGITKGHDLDDRILYDTSSGKLYYDADGSGSAAAVQIALIGTSTHVNLDYSDFLVI